MRGQPEPGQSMGLGRKVDSRPVDVNPEWKRRPDLGPHIWESKDGKLKNAPPTPPLKRTPAEEFFDLFAQGRGGLFP